MKILLTGDSIIARKEGLKEPRINNAIKEKYQMLRLSILQLPE